MQHRRMLGWALGGAALLAGAAGCAADASAAQTREVLVDYVHDEVASSFIAYFPREVTVRPGDTVVFRQEWTGEPHSVTMGTLVDDMMGVVSPLIEEYGLESEPPPDVMERYEAATESLPTMVGEGEDLVVNQNAAQPCFLEEGSPPEDGGQACAEQEQVQPAFTGRQTYYSSGFIPYEGESSNEFTVELSDDIEPGTYNYYCAFHGNFQSGTITVAAPDAEIPSQQEVSRQALAQIDEQAEPLIQGANDAAETPETEVYGVPVAQPFAGWAVEDLTRRGLGQRVRAGDHPGRRG